jgi:hypothetical protein
MMANDHLGHVMSLYKALDSVILQEHNTDLVCLRYTCQLDSDVEFGSQPASHPSVQVDNIGEQNYLAIDVTSLSNVLCKNCPDVAYVSVRKTAWVRTHTSVGSSVNDYTDSLQQLKHSMPFRYEKTKLILTREN